MGRGDGKPFRLVPTRQLPLTGFSSPEDLHFRQADDPLPFPANLDSS